MLRITIPGIESYDEVRNLFIETKATTISLEHSLVSISKWESKWKKPWLSREPKTIEEQYDYVRCMTVNQNVNPQVFNYIPKDIMEQIDSYINDPMTATTLSKTKGTNQIITSEIIYGQMIALNIPSEYQKWHLNRLLTLIGVCDRNNSPKKKMSREEIMAQNRALNAERKAKMHTKG